MLGAYVDGASGRIVMPKTLSVQQNAFSVNTKRSVLVCVKLSCLASIIPQKGRLVSKLISSKSLPFRTNVSTDVHLGPNSVL